eukprot:TRINITY_DN34298_c0_g1_i1.p1 TRINITY_DN34298_c0_g1~~TRINITY_DN34298_c0_g1_i1.p1  ORF type:complete len:245 (-),score=30.44 TRINITY_DN34298_c0_g1_i1:125-859(-)
MAFADLTNTQAITYRCPPNMESLPLRVRSRASKRSFSRPHGLRAWLATCGVTDSNVVRHILDRATSADAFTGSPASMLVGQAVYNKMGHARDSLCREGLVAVYHSAHYCPPCKIFTPELVRFYHEVRAQGIPFEIVFASWDKTQEEFDEYYAEMPWCALPYGDSKIQSLKAKEGVTKIPSLVVYREDGTVVNPFGNSQFCRHDVTEVGLHAMGGVNIVVEAWLRGDKPVVPAAPALSFDMDDDF